MPFFLRSIATAVPPTQLAREETEEVALALGCPTTEQRTWLPNMYQQTGINTRNVSYSRLEVDDVLNKTNISQSIFLPKDDPTDRGPSTGERMQRYQENAGRLAFEAADQAIRSSEMPRNAITHLVTVSCTGFHAPGVDIELIQQLPLSPDTQRTHVGFMGCHGALNGLRVANAYASAKPGTSVLLCAVELCSLHYHYGWEPQKVIANALFADGAGAIVGSTDRKDDSDWQLVASGSHVFLDSNNAMTWTVGDYGFDMTLSRQVPNLISTHLRPWLDHWLNNQGWSRGDIGSWAIHPGGPKILSAVEESLQLEKDDTAISREILAKHGNMSSPTILFILERMRQLNYSRPCVALGFGPGLTVEAALFL